MPAIAFFINPQTWERARPHWEIAAAAGVNMSQFAREVFLAGIETLEGTHGGDHGTDA